MKKSNKFLDLDEMLDSNQKIYVRNNALKSNLLIIAQMKDKNGQKRPLKVPPTRFPINVSQGFSREMIRESIDFRDLLTKGILVLVEASEAEAELSTQEAREEMKSFSLSVFADSAPSNAVRDNLQRLKGQTDAPVVDSTDLLSKKTIDTTEVNHRVQGLVSQLMSKEKPSKDVLTQLKRLKSTMNETDLTYIIKECPKETQIREFAESALAELSASPEAPFQE